MNFSEFIGWAFLISVVAFLLILVVCSKTMLSAPHYSYDECVAFNTNDYCYNKFLKNVENKNE